MIKHCCAIATTLLFILFCGSQVHGMQIITPVEGATSFIEISKKDLTIIKTTLAGVKVMSSSNVLDVKVEGSNVFVKYTSTVAQLQELIITDDEGAIYPLVLKPAGIPSETVILRTRETAHDALGWERSQGYTKSIKELIKSMYMETPPRGYSVQDVNEDAMEWNGAKRVLKKRYSGGLLSGEIYEIHAVNNPITLIEKEFYRKGVLAVSVDKTIVEPEETAKLYIVRKNSGTYR